MSGQVFLGGGGSASDESAVWDAMLNGVRSLLYWPVALSGTMLDGAEEWLQQGLAGRSDVRVTTWKDLSEHSIGIATGIDEDTVGSDDHSGLRLIGADLLPHYTPSWNDHARDWSARHPDRLVIGVPEAGGIRCEVDDPSGRVGVIGPDPVRLFRAGNAVGTVAAGEEVTVHGG